MAMQIPRSFPQRASARQMNGGVSVLSSNPYFSIVRVVANLIGGTTYTVAAGAKVQAFTYKVGDLMTQAGRAAEAATYADTNLNKAGETLDAEVVQITGVKCQLVSPGAQSDPGAYIYSARDISVIISFNGGKSTYPLGNLEMQPGGTGPFAASGVNSRSLNATLGSMNSGMPMWGNHYPMKGGIIWNPAGQTDSTVAVILNPERAITWAAGSGVTATTTFFDIRVEFISQAVTPRSVNQ
jgi:hypothetical protein